MSTEYPLLCRVFGHRYWPDVLHCKRCNHCRGAANLGRTWIRCTRKVVDGQITDEHVGYRPND